MQTPERQNLIGFALRCVIVAVTASLFYWLVPITFHSSDDTKWQMQLGGWCMRDGAHSSKGAIVDHGSVRMECVEDGNGRLYWRDF